MTFSVTSATDPIARENFNKRKRRLKRRPESGRSISDTFGSGEQVADPLVDLGGGDPAMFACSLVVEDGAEGVIFSSGSVAAGALVAVYNNEIIVRAGNGALNIGNAGARVAVPIWAAGLSRKIRLAWSFNTDLGGPIGVRLWSDGKLLAASRSVDAVLAWTDATLATFNGIGVLAPIEVNENRQPYTDSGQPILSDFAFYDQVLDRVGL